MEITLILTATGNIIYKTSLCYNMHNYGLVTILLRFFTFYDTASIVIRFCDTLRFISLMY